jgi:hypothetical protein
VSFAAEIGGLSVAVNNYVKIGVCSDTPEQLSQSATGSVTPQK